MTDSVEEQSVLQSKVDRQRKALDVLNRKVASQRFYLRVLNELGRAIDAEEFKAAKASREDAERLDFELVG